MGARPLYVNVVYSICASWVFQEPEAEVKVECVKGLLERPPEKGRGAELNGGTLSLHAHPPALPPGRGGGRGSAGAKKAIEGPTLGRNGQALTMVVLSLCPEKDPKGLLQGAVS